MADLSHRRSPTPTQPSSAEDPDTAAARKELKQTAISDTPNLPPTTAKTMASTTDTAPRDDESQVKAATPDQELSDAQKDSMKEQISSPKKKRAHDEVDEAKDTTKEANGDVSPISANDSTSASRTTRSEPEKKRARDVSSEAKPTTDAKTSDKSTNLPDSSSSSKPTESTTSTTANSETTTSTTINKLSDTKTTTSEKTPTPTITSAAAFNASGMASFASSSASPFLQSGDNKPLSSFASGPGSASPFAAAAAKSSTPSVFGSGSLSNGSSSPFGQVGGATKPFGSAFGGTFGASTGGSKLSSFASKPGTAFKSSKPAKPFGAPESEGESANEEENEEGSGDDDKDGQEEKDAEDESSTTAADDKKKTRLQRVALDDGEASEATIFQVRAKLFSLDKTEKAWKERGAGNLKINVPQACVDVDEETGGPIPGSFDASALEDADSKVVRLIMRQDSTHRVILNTAVYPAMEFQEKQTTKAVCVLFTAIEGDGEPVSMQIKMSPANAKIFTNEIQKVQRELQAV